MDIDRLKKLDAKVQAIKRATRELIDQAEDIPAVVRNGSRILASVKMLEINLSDLLTLTDTDRIVS